jgi:hypothetical protein
MNPKVQDLINQIKERAARLEYTEDGLAFDKYVGELDLLLYELRTVAWHVPDEGEEIRVLRATQRRLDNIDEWLNELTKELADE